MSKEKIKFIISTLTIISFVAMVLSTLALLIFFPPIKGMSYQVFLGLYKNQALSIHKWSGAIFSILLVINFIFNFKNFKELTKNAFRKKEHHHEAEHQSEENHIQQE